MKKETIPAMTPPVVHDYLREVGKQWSGQGVAVELGSWLGGSAAPLLEGLVEAGYDRPFYCYDSWKANSEQVYKARAKGINIARGQDLLPLFKKNILPIYTDIKAVRGGIGSTIGAYPGDPIEICLFDAPKREPVFSNAVHTLSPYWIPGVTILGLMDYWFYSYKPKNLAKKLMAPVHFIDAHPDCFTKVKEWPGRGKLHSCVFFKYEKSLT